MPNAPKERRPTSEVLQGIKDNAANVRSAAAELTARIEKFEAYLGTVRGRTETRYYGDHPSYADDEGPPHYLVLLLQRIIGNPPGKQWILQFAETFDGQDEPLDWTRLTEAPIVLKMAAVKMFPDILEAIEKTQGKLVKQLKQAVAEYDQFEASLPTESK